MGQGCEFESVVCYGVKILVKSGYGFRELFRLNLYFAKLEARSNYASRQSGWQKYLDNNDVHSFIYCHVVINY